MLETNTRKQNFNKWSFRIFVPTTLLLSFVAINELFILLETVTPQEDVSDLGFGLLFICLGIIGVIGWILIQVIKIIENILKL